MGKKRNIVGVTHRGSNVKLDVDRVIAIDKSRMILYFESCAWQIEDDGEFFDVWNAWVGEV